MRTGAEDMLKYFNAALTKLGRARPFDHLAAMAQLALDSGPVALVDLAPLPTIIGCSEDAAGMGEQVIRMACDLDPVDLADIGEPVNLPLAGASLPFDPPWNSAILVPMVGGGRRVAFLVFVPPQGIAAQRLSRFVAAARRQVAENALTQRYRSDLKRYIMMFDHLERTANIGVWECDLVGGSMFWSDEMFRIHDRSPGEPMPSVSQALDYFVAPYNKQLEKQLLSSAVSSAPLDVTMPIETDAGRRRTVRVIAQRQAADGDGPERLAGVLQDVTAAHEASERLWWTANHDALTRLPNRALFADRFKTALDRRKRTSHFVCLVLVDVDDFKQVNDTLGHAAGDRLLCLVAERLKKIVRANDTVARTGGDEFSILLEDLESTGALDAVLERLRRNLDIRLTWEARTVLVNLSAGAAIAPDHGESEHDLICAADLALYRMKTEPRSALALYTPTFGHERQERTRLMVAAREALDEGRIVPWYQPQVCVASGRIVGVEVVARWVEGDTVRAASDVACVTADHELGSRIGAAVVGRAFADIARLNRDRDAKLTLAVGSASGDWLRESFLHRVGSCRETAPGDAGQIGIEIAEGIVVDDPTGRVGGPSGRSGTTGTPWSPADFAADERPPVRVSRLPMCQVRVDRRVVAGLEGDPDGQAVVRGVIEMARSLSLRLIVEGVETAEQVRTITALGGRFADGEVGGRVVPLETLEALLAEDAGAEDQPRLALSR